MKFVDKKDLPTGAISVEDIDKLYISRVLENNGQADLVPVLAVMAKGAVLEEMGHMKEARGLYIDALKNHPHNEHLKTALMIVKLGLN